ncbi:replication-relaxation family protein [Bacillus sp. Gen3]|nr:replication-relaxation family protein [Bacillus sp. Gen3]
MGVTTTSKEQRHENILLSLKKLGFASRSQLQRLHGLGGVRNANRILKELEPFLNCVRRSENVYYLNTEGRERVDAARPLNKTMQVDHYLMRNSLYIALGCPSTWRTEVKLAVQNEVSVIADAIYTMAGAYHIVEVDHMQKMTANRVKIQKYRKLIDLGVFSKPPRFIWITTTEYRRKQLTRYCEGLNVRVYTTDDLK